MTLGQTLSDYKPNKHIRPDVLRHMRRSYQHLDALVEIARSGVRASLSKPVPRHRKYPVSHKSVDNCYAVLPKNIRKKQDSWLIWPKMHISPSVVADKGDEDPLVSGRIDSQQSVSRGAVSKLSHGHIVSARPRSSTSMLLLLKLYDSITTFRTRKLSFKPGTLHLPKRVYT
ncbi:hypothetical protein GN244_ATG17881 [Phytophthora infestans]|uniref:Uncharacterized protein n=1 Tax=Phytophthora infestans TaxID=4787 RepID=A0A833RQ91_PHYIN|nr:hypothetical protein GN244_ATG17881 [Phytophthora infestans]